MRPYRADVIGLACSGQRYCFSQRRLARRSTAGWSEQGRGRLGIHAGSRDSDSKPESARHSAPTAHKARWRCKANRVPASDVHYQLECIQAQRADSQ